MSESFDPYHVWLGIPPAEQPPNHYRLLALAMYEDVPEVIENAADRQMAHVRKAASGRHADHSQKILNEISAARRCLLDRAKKDAYDVELRAKNRPPAKEPAMPAAAPPTSGNGEPAGIQATTEWVPTRPPKRPAAKPAAPPLETGDRWKGARSSSSKAASIETPRLPGTKESNVSVSVAAPTSIAQRTRAKKQVPWILLVVIVGVAILPILALLYALASISSDTADADSDGASTVASVDGASPSGAGQGGSADDVDDADGTSLPTPGESTTDGDATRPRRPRPGRPFLPNDPNDNRDPLDDTPSFGRGSQPPDLYRGLVALWDFASAGSQKPAVDRGRVGEPDEQKVIAPTQVAAHIDGAVVNPEMFYDHASWLERPRRAFTFAIWFRPHSVVGSQIIAGKRNLTAPHREWHLVRSNDRVFARFHDGGSLNKEMLLAVPEGTLKQNQWTLAVVRYDEDGRTDGYMQSLWVGLAGSTSLLRQDRRTSIAMPVSDARFGIGDDDSAPALDGDVDEAAYWDRALTAEEVELYFNDGKGRTAPF